MRFPKLSTFATLGALLLSSPAWAVAPCGQVVVDEAGFLKDSDRIERLAQPLIDMGATVRIRITEDHDPYDTLLEAANNICDAWGSANGVAPANFIVIWATKNDKGLGVYKGDVWAEELPIRFTDGLVERGRGKISMAFAGGQFDQGIVIGLNAIKTQIERAQAPAPAAPVTIIQEPREPVDLMPIAYAIGAVVVAVFLIFSIIYGLRYYGRLRGARQVARSIWGAVYGQFTRLNDTIDRIKALIGEGVAVDWVDPLVLAGWRRLLKREADEAAADNDSFRMTEEEHFREIGSAEEFEEAARSLKENLENLTGHADALQRLEDEISLQSDLFNGFADDKAAEIADCTAAEEAVAARKTEGFVVTPLTTDLETALALIDKAQEAFEDRDYNGANAKLTTADGLITSVQAASDELPARRDELNAFHQTLSERAAVFDREVEEARTIFGHIKDMYAWSNVDTVAGNGSHAERMMEPVPGELEAIRTLLHDQSWNEAEDRLAILEKHLTAVFQLLSAITELSKQLKDDHIDAVEEAEEAHRSIVAARAFLDNNTAMVASLQACNRQLHQAIAKLQTAQRLLAGDQPDVITAFALVTEADDLADGVLKLATNERDTLVKKRAKAKKLAREMTQSLKAATDYQSNHSYDVGSTAERYLREAAELSDLDDVTDLDTFIVQAQKAIKKSKSALKRAKSDVESASSSSSDSTSTSIGGLSGSTGSFGSFGGGGGGLSGSTGGW